VEGIFTVNIELCFGTGGDLRIDTSDKLVHAAIVSEGVSFGSADVVTAYVVQQALGGAPFVQYGLNASSRLNKAAATVTNQPYSVVNSYFVCYLVVWRSGTCASGM
jgi:hypothetical protein